MASNNHRPPPRLIVRLPVKVPPSLFPPEYKGQAGARVVAVVEILEMILIHSDYWELLKLLRISKQFNTVILGSITLRKALWLQHDDARTMSVEVLSDHYESKCTEIQAVELHPFLYETWDWYVYDREDEWTRYDRDDCAQTSSLYLRGIAYGQHTGTFIEGLQLKPLPSAWDSALICRTQPGSRLAIMHVRFSLVCTYCDGCYESALSMTILANASLSKFLKKLGDVLRPYLDGEHCCIDSEVGRMSIGLKFYESW